MTIKSSIEPTREFHVDQLAVEIHADRNAMGSAAADYVVSYLRSKLGSQGEVRMVVGSAPSQDEFFAALTSAKNRELVDWSRVVVFHMDEYVGLAADHPQSFRSYQREHLLAHVSPKAFHEIHGEADNVDAECKRLSRLLSEQPIDLVCLGIGENGHLAFNDPPANFNEDEWVKVVELDAVCRQQQVNDGCFATIDAVPTHAITLSLRVFQSALKLSGVIPARTKATAVLATVEGPVSPACPATLLRNHPDARIFLDPASSALLTEM